MSCLSFDLRAMDDMVYCDFQHIYRHTCRIFYISLNGDLNGPHQGSHFSCIANGHA